MRVVEINLLESDEYDRYTLDGEPFTGTAVEHHPGGGLWSEVPIVAGLAEGLVREWYEDGQLKSEESFRRGGLNGPRRIWHRNGQLAEEGTFEHGICLERRQWDEQGWLATEYRLDPDPNDANFKFLELFRAIERRRSAEEAQRGGE